MKSNKCSRPSGSEEIKILKQLKMFGLGDSDVGRQYYFLSSQLPLNFRWVSGNASAATA